MITQRHESELFETLLRFGKAQKCIEIGVFTGSSALSIARGIGPSGKLIAVDVSDTFTNLAKKYWKIAGVDERIELVIRPGVEYLNQLIEQGEENTFDFAFVDADKENYPNYFDLLIRLVKPGGIIAFDNVFWGNKVSDPEKNDEETLAFREVNRKCATDPRVKHFMLPIADGINFITKL
jgi:caffeoyl-CoA O-methyltransferase